MRYYDAYENLSVEDKITVQSERLRKLVHTVYQKVPFYRKKLDQLGIKPEDINELSDLQKLPFTTKQDLRNNYPFGLFALSTDDIVRLHASSGTTGRPTVVGYSHADIQLWTHMVARTLVCAGVSRNDLIQIAYGYGLFTGGLGFHYGAEKLGTTVIPISGGNTRRQIQLMQDFGSTVLACTPSYALFLAEVMDEIKVHTEDLSLRIGILGAEPWTENMRKQIESKLNIKAIDMYGLSEIIGPGVAVECEHQQGLHINDDHFFPEIIDPDSGQVLPDGEKGELVLTTLTKEGLPLLRYRTRDLTRLNRERCKCGRTLVRMEKCTGRTDDMLIIRGVNIFPSQIESVLLEMRETQPHYLLIVDRINNLDVLEVWVEIDSPFFSDEIRELESLSARIKNNIESTLGIGVKVKLVEPKTIERTEGKAKRVIDKRTF
ncbi:AMP-binding protein [candidate division KSB1 bacterium]|nr:AMP-binding protein [candidate division KSB1 bacterium]